MRSAQRGKATLAAEVTNVSASGFWILLDGREMFLSFARFPWFRRAAIGDIVNVSRPSARHLYWPLLDIDLAVGSIRHPERYPLVSKVLPDHGRRRSGGARRAERPPRRTLAARR